MNKSTFNLYKDNKYVGFGNPNMLKTYTDQEIEKFYKRFNIDVEILRSEK